MTTPIRTPDTRTPQARTPQAQSLQLCGGAGGEVLSREDAEELAKLLKAVADPVRLQILSLLRSQPQMSACACDITPAVGLSQPTVSHHLKVLTVAGVLTRERRGAWAWFTVDPARLEQIVRLVC